MVHGVLGGELACPAAFAPQAPVRVPVDVGSVQRPGDDPLLEVLVREVVVTLLLRGFVVR